MLCVGNDTLKLTPLKYELWKYRQGNSAYEEFNMWYEDISGNVKSVFYAGLPFLGCVHSVSSASTYFPPSLMSLVWQQLSCLLKKWAICIWDMTY